MLAINEWHTPWLDSVMVFLSAKLVWIPLYIAVLFLIYKRHGWNTGLWIFGAIILSVMLADTGSVHLFKNVVQRYRPCHHLSLKEVLHLPNGCGGMYGFISSHAANHFALAVGWMFYLPRAKWWWLVWAVLIALSRVYLGVHYFTDIIAGAIWGSSVALFAVWLIRKKLKNHVA